MAARSDLPIEGGGRATHPVVFLLLNVPFGALGGYITVTLGYLLGQSGVSAADIAALVAASLLPNTWKFAWAPLVDTTLTRKTWYTLGTLLTAVGIAAMGFVPAVASQLALLTTIVFAVSLVGRVEENETGAKAARFERAQPPQRRRANHPGGRRAKQSKVRFHDPNGRGVFLN